MGVFVAEVKILLNWIFNFRLISVERRCFVRGVHGAFLEFRLGIEVLIVRDPCYRGRSIYVSGVGTVLIIIEIHPSATVIWFSLLSMIHGGYLRNQLILESSCPHLHRVIRCLLLFLVYLLQFADFRLRICCSD